MRAWEELEGRRRNQVTRFQAMAPSRAAIIVGTVTAWGRTNSDPMVVATATPKRKGPLNSPTAANQRAGPGSIAPETTMVEITLLLS